MHLGEPLIIPCEQKCDCYNYDYACFKDSIDHKLSFKDSITNWASKIACKVTQNEILAQITLFHDPNTLLEQSHHEDIATTYKQQSESKFIKHNNI
jgi:hypothetical protein